MTQHSLTTDSGTADCVITSCFPESVNCFTKIDFGHRIEYEVAPSFDKTSASFL